MSFTADAGNSHRNSFNSDGVSEEGAVFAVPQPSYETRNDDYWGRLWLECIWHSVVGWNSAWGEFPVYQTLEK